MMPSFITEDFLLQSEIARELYHEYAEHEPIFDYHCHLPPDQLAENKTFRNLYEIWLAGDHYKWRAMRSNGVPEKYCTGDASDWDKFLAYARTVPHTLRNPLYHWTHIELKRFFGIQKLWQAVHLRLPGVSPGQGAGNRSTGPLEQVDGQAR
jgi:glucuronate isomerase